MLEKVKKFIDDSFGKKKPHFENTIYWLKKLKPDADEPMLIAAYAHDAARISFRPDSIPRFWKKHEWNEPEYLKKHQEYSEKIIVNFLKKENYEENKIKRIAKMVRYHEVGGSPESDLIKDADSLSYLDVNVKLHLKLLGDYLGKEKMKKKFDFMYNRISSKKGKELAKPMYEKALKTLAEFFK